MSNLSERFRNVVKSWIGREWLAFALIFLVGMALRVPDPEQGLNNDELAWVQRGHDLLRQFDLDGSISGIKSKALKKKRHVPASGDEFPFDVSIKAHHPGYFTAWLSGLGLLLHPGDYRDLDHLIGLRLMQAIPFSAFCAFLAWFLRRELGSSLVVSVALGGLLVTEPQLVGETRQIKQDGLAVVLSGCLILMALRYLRRPSRGTLLGLASIGALMLATKLALAPVFLVVLCSVALAHPSWRERAAIAGLFAGVSYGVFLLLAPNIWGDPITGPLRLLGSAAGSEQLQGKRAPFWWDVYYDLRMLRHISVPAVAMLGVALFAVWRLRRSVAWMLGSCMLLILATACVSTWKSTRYILPVLPLAAIAIARPLTDWWTRRPRLTRAVLLLSLASHLYSFATFYPYHLVYTWEFWLTPENPKYESISTAILGPQVARELSQRGIKRISMWNRGSFSYYYDGEIVGFDAMSMKRKDRPEWLLISNKHVKKFRKIKKITKTFAFKERPVLHLVRLPKGAAAARLTQ